MAVIEPRPACPAMMAEAQDPATAGGIGAAFLRWLDSAGTHNLVAIDPDNGALEARTFTAQDHAEIAPWVDARAGRLNIYYTANEVRADLGPRKPTKADIVYIRAIYTDVDPAHSADVETERERILASLQTGVPLPFGAVVDSGGGYQALAVLENKMPVANGVQDWAESHGRGLAAVLDGDSVQNIDRLLRLPGPENIPDDKKRARGRTRRPAQIVQHTERRVSRIDVEACVTPMQRPATDNDAGIAAAQSEISHSGFDDAGQYMDLPADLRDRFEADMSRDSRLARLWRDGEIHGPNRSGSDYRIKLAGLLKAQSGYSAECYAALAWVWRLSHVQRYGRDDAVRQLGRDWGNAEPATRQLDVSEFFSPEPAAAFDDAKDQAPARRRRLSVMSFAEAADRALADSAEPLVDGWLDVGAVSVFYGPSNVGKTFVVLDLAHSVANGWPWAGHETKRSGVLYVAAEGGGGIRKHFAALQRTHGTAPANFVLASDSLSLCDQPEDVQAVIDAAGAVPGGCGLVVIDTLAQTIGRDENSTADMSRFVRQIDRIRTATGAHVLIVHHTGKDESRGARGSVALKGAVDTEVEVMDGKMRTHKQRDRERAPDLPFTLEPVPLGRNAKGQAVTSAVARPGVASTFERVPDAQVIKDLSDSECAALVALQEATNAAGQTGAKAAAVAAHIRSNEPGITDEAAAARLKRLKKQGLAVQPRRGHWRVAPNVQAHADPVAGPKQRGNAEKTGHNILSYSDFQRQPAPENLGQKDTKEQETGHDIFG